jgi:2-methylcitrate dehydratase PrpD
LAIDRRGLGVVSRADRVWEVSAHLVGTAREDLPADVVAATTRSVLDTLGVMVAASSLAPGVVAIVEHVAECGGTPQSTVLGFGTRAPAALAALANGALAHALDYEEVSTPLGHPSASTLPAALAVAERVGATGSELLRAVALGNDLFVRLVRSFPAGGPWHKVTVAGHFASAAAAGLIAGLDEEQMVDALGLAFAQASGTMELRYGVGSDIGGFRDAFTNHAGVTAALLAGRGLHGVRSCFDGKAGLYNAFFGGRADPSVLTDGLGTTFLRAAAQKPWPACGGTHSHIEAALALRAEHHVDSRDVDQIEVWVGDTTVNLCTPLSARQRPETSLDAKFSIPFATAVALVHGSPRLRHFSVEGLADPAVLDLAAKVTPRLDAAYQHGHGLRPGRVDLRMHDGRLLSRHVDIASYYASPMSDEQLVAKFVECVSCSVRPLHTEEAHALVDELLHLDRTDSVSAVVRQLCR